VFIPLIGGAEIGREMVRSDFDAMVFTGSISTGLDIMHNSGVKPLILELSGNDPAIVCADADIDQAVRGVAQGTFSHGGQVCIRIKRVYVVESIAQKFIDRLLELIGRIDVREEIGPLIREDARKKVQVAVDKAITAGAELLCGGRSLDGPGFYIMPTVLLVRQGKNIRFDEEIFGPVCPIIIVEDENEALILANDSKYGLGGSIWTKDAEKGQELAMKMESGTIWINECGRTLTCGDYFQGWKSSGISSTSDRLGLFMKKKAIIHHCSSAPREHWMK
jgi:acyl-CoA reductase-like NAD-dependent aldehyde dehydrogenase